MLAVALSGSMQKVEMSYRRRIKVQRGDKDRVKGFGRATWLKKASNTAVANRPVAAEQRLRITRSFRTAR
jgi:hypothetical protein